MGTVRFDTSELDDLADDLLASPADVMHATVRVTSQAGADIERDARTLIEGQIRGRYLPHYPKAISHETWVSPSEVTAEIGPDSAKLQGGMGPGVELGSANAPPLPHMFPAFDANVPRWLEALAREAGDVL